MSQYLYLHPQQMLGFNQAKRPPSTLFVPPLRSQTMDSPWVDNSSTSTYYCWVEDPSEASTHENVFSMTVNRDMFNYFSQPGGQINLTSFVDIYCLNPLGNDNCPVGLCPNYDIAGLLVRIACMFFVSFLQRTVV